MAEVCMSSDADGRRRLPLWMVKSKTNNESAKSESADKSKPKSHRVDEAPAQIKSAKKKRAEPSCDGDEQRCRSGEKATSKRKKFSAAGQRSDDHEYDLEGKKPIKRRVVVTRTRIPSSPVVADDDIELTMDDLLSIAQEYVNADEEKRRREEARRDSRTKKPAIPTLSEVASQRTPLATGLTSCSSRADSHHTDPTKHQEVDRKENAADSANAARTGDAAQDMLNLFLGPLLSKAPDKEVNSEGAPEQMNIIEICRGDARENDAYAGRFNLVEQPLAKKKSSLKDKIAAFLG